MITLRQLEIFASVIEHRSFRRCGEHLGISQGSISEHIKSLETNLGVQLFERVKGGALQLTDAGHQAEEGVQDLLAHAYDFMELVAGDGPEHTPLHIAMHGFMMRNLGAAVAEWNATAPRPIQLHSNENPSTTLARQVAARELHAAYFYSVEGMDDPGEVVGHEELGIFVAADHPLAGKPIVTLADLEEVPVVSLSTEKPLRRAIEAVLAKIGISKARHAIETAEFGLILSSLHRKAGYCCMFHATSEEVMQTQGLAEIRFHEPLPRLEVRRLARRSTMRSATLREALALLEQAWERT